jgi:quercetin dioxygenase-like cupin family protein
MKLLLMTALLLLATLAVGQQSRNIEPDLPDDVEQHAVISEQIDWMPCAENLPAGCEIAVLEGSPRTAELFTVRFRLREDFVMPAHTHPNHERVTILGGRMSVAFGVDAIRDNAKRFGPGDYYVNARGAVHTVWVDEPAELQITGFGPWEAHFVARPSPPE